MNRTEKKHGGHSAPLSQRGSASLCECVTVSCGPFSPRGVLFPLPAPAPSPANPFETHTHTHFPRLRGALRCCLSLHSTELHTHTHTTDLSSG